MTLVLDANVLLRFIDATAALHPVAVAALKSLRVQGCSLRTVPQSLYEVWVVGTRPIANNGLGLSPVECDQTIAGLLTAFPLLNDAPNLFVEWRALVTTHACLGKPAHDARYVAAMNTHGVLHLVTFNISDFQRYTHLTLHDPRVIAAALAGQIDSSSG